uniref:Uncharacterized protein n=1 Tax=viral metagenome TaxID=1070528 RepID=A0A6C0AG55_9ZZZZ|tara:strand:- start:11189 stop:11938 length:750 start_codon:yes stop_codon:yes gene_type:complete
MNESPEKWDLQDIIDLDKLKEDDDQNYEYPIYDSNINNIIDYDISYNPLNPSNDSNMYHTPSSTNDSKIHIEKKKTKGQQKLQSGKKQKTKKSSFISKPSQSKKKMVRFSNKPYIQLINEDPTRGKGIEHSIALETQLPGSALSELTQFKNKKQDILEQQLLELPKEKRQEFIDNRDTQYEKNILESSSIIKELSEKKYGGYKYKSNSNKSYTKKHFPKNKYSKKKTSKHKIFLKSKNKVKTKKIGKYL